MVLKIKLQLILSIYLLSKTFSIFFAISLKYYYLYKIDKLNIRYLDLIY